MSSAIQAEDHRFLAIPIDFGDRPPGIRVVEVGELTFERRLASALHWWATNDGSPVRLD
jgi:hypothetical protein